MAPRDRLHIYVRRPATSEAYTSYATGRGNPRPPSPIRSEHAERLTNEARAAEQAATTCRIASGQQLGAEPLGTGLLITFQSWPGFELELSSLDPARQPPELVSVVTRGDDSERVQMATVHVPEGSLSFFLNRIDDYANRDTQKGNPRNANLAERIAGIRLATIEALWTDDRSAFPDPTRLHAPKFRHHFVAGRSQWQLQPKETQLRARLRRGLPQ
jgi:hypothetical protein